MINERKLSKSELDKREDIIMNMKKNKRDLVKKYGKDAEAVMYGRATNMAKKATKETRDPRLTELIKDALKNPKKADLDKDGKLSDYEKTRGAAIEKSMDKDIKEHDLDIGHEDNEIGELGEFNLNDINKTITNMSEPKITLDNFVTSKKVNLKPLIPPPKQRKINLTDENLKTKGIKKKKKKTI